MEQIIKGSALMLFDENKKSLGFATAHTLNINSDIAEIATKDHGIYGSSEVTKLTWDLSTDNLYSEKSFGDLVSKQLQRTPIQAYFGYAEDWNGQELSGDAWELDTNNSYFWGNVVISSISVNANAGENSTFTANFSGRGELHHYAYVAE